MNPSVKDIQNVLPQTQCKECGFNGCLPYAQALQTNQAAINLCVPGGVNTLQALGRLLQKDPTPYLEEMQLKARPPQLASIDESSCIGCTKCIQACPVDAIFGASKQMHVIIEQDCTGCGLCVEPCPVDCITLLPLKENNFDPQVAKLHYEQKQQRQLREKQKQEALFNEKRKLRANTTSAQTEKEAKKAYILAAIERSKQKKS